MSDTKPLWPQVPFAFPFDVQVNHERHVNPGMTLRDYFAAQTLHAVLAEPMPSDLGDVEPYDFAARASYAIADAMLKAREGK